MTDAVRGRGRTLALESLESRCLLSNLAFPFAPSEELAPQPVRGLTSARSVGPERAEAPTHAGSAETPLRLPIDIEIRDSPATARNGDVLEILIDPVGLKNAIDSSQFALGTEGQSAKGPLSKLDTISQDALANLRNKISAVGANVYTEADWLVIEIVVTPQAETNGAAHIPSLDLPDSSPSDPANSAAVPALIVPHVTYGPASTNARSLVTWMPIEITAISSWASEDATSEDAAGGLRSTEASQIPSYLADGSDVEVALDRSGSAPASPYDTDLGGALSLDSTFSSTSSVGQSTVPETEDRSSSEPGQSPVVHTAGSTESEVTQGSSAANSQPASTVEIAAPVKGVKIRGVFSAPLGSPQGKRVTDLAIIRFERPMPVRVQLPFVLDSQHELSQSVSIADALGAASAEAVDAVLAGSDSEGSGLGVIDWRTTATLAVVTALLGFAFGRRSGASTTHATDTPSEPFTATFDEVQLRRLTRRLDLDTRHGNRVFGVGVMRRKVARRVVPQSLCYNK